MGMRCVCTGGADFPCRSGTKDGQCDPGEYLSCPECGGGHPCEADFREAGIYEAGGSGKDRKGSDEGTSERPLDSLQYSDYPVWEDDLHGEKPKVWGLFLAKVL